MLSRRKSLWLDLGPGLFSWGQENENTINTHVTQSKCWGIWRAAGHRGGRYQPQGKAGVWLLLVILTLMLYVWVKEKKKGYTLIILYKRHQLPFQKQMGRLHSPSSVTGQHLPWNSAAGLTLVFSLFPSTCALSQHYWLQNAGDTAER